MRKAENVRRTSLAKAARFSILEKITEKVAVARDRCSFSVFVLAFHWQLACPQSFPNFGNLRVSRIGTLI